MKKGLNLIARYWKLTLILIIGVHLLLLTYLNFFPYPELFVYSYLTEAGLTPYKQIFDQHFPGVMFFPVNLASLGINTVSKARYLHLGLIALVHPILFVVGKSIFKSRTWALSANFLYLIWQPFFEGYVLWIDLFVVPIILLAFYFLVRKDLKDKKNLFYAGVFLGISLLFKQTALPLIAILFLYLWVKTKNFGIIAHFLYGLAIPLSVLLVWVTGNAIWEEFLYWSVSFNLTTFAQMGRKYPTLTGFVKASPVFGLGIVGLVWVIRKKVNNKNVLLGVFLLGSFAFAYARFDFVHLQPSLPFAVLGALLFMKEIKDEKALRSLAVLLLLASFFLVLPFYKVNKGDEVLFYGEFEKRLSNFVLNYAEPGDSIFAMGTTPHIYQLTNTLPPGKNFVFQFPWFMVEAEEDIYEGLITDPPVVVVRDKSASVQGMNLVSFMPKIDEHIERYYEPVGMIDEVEVLVREEISDGRK